MGRRLKVYLNDGSNGRKLVEAEVVADRGRTLLVQLPDGNTIVRKKSRDLPKEESSENL